MRKWEAHRPEGERRQTSDKVDPVAKRIKRAPYNETGNPLEG